MEMGGVLVRVQYVVAWIIAFVVYHIAVLLI